MFLISLFDYIPAFNIILTPIQLTYFLLSHFTFLFSILSKELFCPLPCVLFWSVEQQSTIFIK